MKISVLGTGLMGAPMAQRLIAASHSVTVYNRTPEKLSPLKATGAIAAPSPADAIAASPCSILMLSNATAIREVLFSRAARDALSGRTIIQMGTIAPAESKAIYHDVRAAGGEYLESPVLGSIPQAKSGELILMVGSTTTQFEQWKALLRCFGHNPVRLGEVGCGAAVKLGMNQLIGSLTAAFAMSLGLVQREGIDIEQFMAIVRESALYAPTFDKKLSRMVNRDFENPNFPTKHLLKDMTLFAAAAEEAGIDATAAAAVGQVVQRAIAMGLADKDYSALFAAVSPADSAG